MTSLRTILTNKAVINLFEKNNMKYENADSCIVFISLMGLCSRAFCHPEEFTQEELDSLKEQVSYINELHKAQALPVV